MTSGGQSTKIEINFRSKVLSVLDLLLQRTFWKVRQENVVWDRIFRIQCMNITVGTESNGLVQVLLKFTNYKFALLTVPTTRKHMKPFIIKAMGRCIT